MRSPAFVLLSALSLLQTAPSPDPTRMVLSASLLSSSGIVSVARLGPHTLEITESRDGKETIHRLSLARLPGDAVIVSARAIGYMSKAILVAFVAERGGKHTYHFAHDADHVASDQRDPDGWLVSDAIFESDGDPFRISDLANPGGDTIEITFRRGLVTELPPSGAKVEVRLYWDNCPVFRSTRMPGRTVLLETAGWRDASGR